MLDEFMINWGWTTRMKSHHSNTSAKRNDCLSFAPPYHNHLRNRRDPQRSQSDIKTCEVVSRLTPIRALVDKRWNRRDTAGGPGSRAASTFACRCRVACTTWRTLPGSALDGRLHIHPDGSFRRWSDRDSCHHLRATHTKHAASDPDLRCRLILGVRPNSPQTTTLVLSSMPRYSRSSTRAVTA